MPKVDVVKGDVTKHESEEKFHAVFCDPPYHLTSIVKRFGKEGSAPAQHGKDGAFGRVGKGFMGKVWDGGDVAFRPETWNTILSNLYPGGFGMAFSSAKLYHRLAVAIEDGGAVLHPQIAGAGWLSSQGFPKATRIDTQMDRLFGAEDDRRVVGKYQHPDFGEWNLENATDKRDVDVFSSKRNLDVVEVGSELGRTWQGHRYGQQALAPAIEPLCVFQRPYDGRAIDDMLATGAGALWIDGGRTGMVDGDDSRIGHAGDRISSSPLGRWPKNFFLVHTPDCVCVGYADDNYTINRFVDGAKPFGNAIGEEYSSSEIKNRALVWECADECAIKHFDQKYGNHKSGVFSEYTVISSGWGFSGGERSRTSSAATYGDEGGVSRFFYQSHWMYETLEQLNQNDMVFYSPKASKSEKNAGLAGFDAKTVNDGRNTPIDNPFHHGLLRWFAGEDVIFDYSQVRPAGSPLRIKGGQASGHESLKRLLDFSREKIRSKAGGRLSTLDCHDIMCMVGSIVVSGGVRRSALLALFDEADDEMRNCKQDIDWERGVNTHRAMANNSVVWTGKKSLEEMIHELKEHRHLVHRGFNHKKSGQHYQLLMQVFNESTNELMAVYCLSAWTQLKFVRPMTEFIEKFEESKG